MQRLHLETDSQRAGDAMGGGANQGLCIVLIIMEIRELSVSCIVFTLMYTSRSCNRVAHTVAKQVLDDNRLGVWQNAPTCIAHLLTGDCNLDVFLCFMTMNESPESKK